MMDDTKKYNVMEECLQRINGEYINFPKSVKARNNKILKQVLEPLIENMKQKDKRFNQLYKTKFFGGSYYDGLKVGSPNEYDIDLLLKFPSSHEIEILTDTDTPGYVNLYLPRKSGFEKFCENSEEEFESCLDTKKVLSWMEGIVQRALNDMTMLDLWYTFEGDEIYNVRFIKGGPAFTLIIKGVMGDEEDMYVDLVPCFSFAGDKWPEGFKYLREPYRNSELSEFFVVPKHPKEVRSLYKSKFWRLSFQIQERHLINNLNRLKPALKLLKKMRDVQQQTRISSYFIKTVFLWEVLEHPTSFWNTNSLSYIFMFMLKKYQELLANRQIAYFWNDDFNLLDGVHGDVFNMSNRLRYIITTVERNLHNDPDKIAEYLLTSFEYRFLNTAEPQCDFLWPNNTAAVAVREESPSICLLL